MLEETAELLLRSCAVANRVAFERQYGPDAAGLYRLLWGFNDEQLEKEKATEITLDLGMKNLPIHQVKLDFKEENFFRRVKVEGRDRETYIKVINTENGKVKKEEYSMDVAITLNVISIPFIGLSMKNVRSVALS